MTEKRGELSEKREENDWQLAMRDDIGLPTCRLNTWWKANLISHKCELITQTNP